MKAPSQATILIGPEGGSEVMRLTRPLRQAFSHCYWVVEFSERKQHPLQQLLTCNCYGAVS